MAFIIFSWSIVLKTPITAYASYLHTKHIIQPQPSLFTLSNKSIGQIEMSMNARLRRPCFETMMQTQEGTRKTPINTVNTRRCDLKTKKAAR